MNKKKYVYILFLFVALLLPLVLCSHSAFGKEPYEGRVELKASSILPSHILNNNYYSIKERVENDGFTNTYTVLSRNGKFKALSNIDLFKLLGEIEAIEAMNEIEESDVFIKSFKESGAATVEGIKNLVNDPGATLDSAATGLSSLFSRAEESIFQSSPGETEDSRIEQTIGFSHSKRQVAYRYHVDVYSQNQLLQEHLDRIAWAEYAGGITLGVATMPVGGLAGATLTVSGTARLLGEVIATTPPAELKLQNRQKLERMGIVKGLIDLFIENPHFSPLQQTAFIMALEETRVNENKSLPLEIALRAANHHTAAVITTTMIMLAGYDKHVTPLVGFKRVAGLFCAVNKNREVIVMLPADHITWNKRLADGAASFYNKGNRFVELWAMGTISPLAQKELKSLGWKVEENVEQKISSKRS